MRELLTRMGSMKREPPWPRFLPSSSIIKSIRLTRRDPNKSLWLSTTIPYIQSWERYRYLS